MNHNDTYNYVYTPPIPNWPPVLRSGLATPLDTTEDDPVTFKVTYADPDNDPPGTMKVHIKDAIGQSTGHDLSPAPSGNSWIVGKPLKFTTTLFPGTYTYRFEASDGELDAIGDIGWNATEVTIRPRNNVPELASDGVAPIEGTTDTLFRYSVRYRDVDNEAPASARIVIDDESHDMLTSNPTGPWNNWVTFYYETQLDAGQNHRYHFLFSDGEDSVRLPAADASPNRYMGPTVETPNYAPILTGGLVAPVEGTRDSKFTFSVIYTDGEGDHPTTSYVYIDGVAKIMTSDTSDYTLGAMFTYQTYLDTSPHVYYFQFSDGENTVRMPETGSHEGPTVINRDPTAVISAPASGSRFTPDELIRFESKGSDDLDGDSLEFTWTSDIDLFLGDTATLDTYLSEGDHLITLAVDDGFGGVTEVSIQVEVRPYVPVPHVDTIEVDIERPIEGDAVRVTITVSNKGESRIVGEDVILTLEGEELDRETVSVDVAGTRSVTFTWSAPPGDHTLVVTFGESSTSLALRVTANNPPTITPGLVNEGETFTTDDELYFRADVEDAEGDSVTYTWDFGDGTPTSTKDAPSHIYAEPGVYNVTLTVLDERGGVTERSFQVEIVKPKADDESPGPGAIAALAAIAAVAVLVISSRGRSRGRHPC
jgi:hypothetical protein